MSLLSLINGINHQRRKKATLVSLEMKLYVDEPLLLVLSRKQFLFELWGVCSGVVRSVD